MKGMEILWKWTNQYKCENKNIKKDHQTKHPPKTEYFEHYPPSMIGIEKREKNMADK